MNNVYLYRTFVRSTWNGTVSGTVKVTRPSQTPYGSVAQLDRATAF